MKALLTRLGLWEREFHPLGGSLEPAAVGELLEYHADSRERRSSYLIVSLRALMMVLSALFVPAYTAVSALLGWLTGAASSQLLLPPALMVASFGAGAAFAGLFVRTPAHIEVYPAEDEAEDFFHLASGWTALEKYVAWLWADFVPFLRIWLWTGATAMLYFLLGAAAPGLQIHSDQASSLFGGAVQAPASGPLGPSPSAAVGLLPSLMLGWLFFAVSILLFHLLVSQFPLHIGDSGARNRLTGLLLFLFGLPVLGMLSGSMDPHAVDILQELGSLNRGILSVWPVLVLLGLLWFGLVYRARGGRWGSQVLLGAVWLIPVWAGLALVVGGSVLILQGVEATLDVPMALTVPPALTLVAAYLLLNPFVGLSAFLTTENMSALYLTSPFLETLSNPQAYGDGLPVYTEPVLVIATLLAIAALFVHGYLAFRNRGRGLKPWE